MTIETLGIDIAKNVFQLHGVNRGGRVVFKRRVMRDQLLEVVSRIDRCTIAVEACTGAFYWACKFEGLGHQVRIISPQFRHREPTGNPQIWLTTAVRWLTIRWRAWKSLNILLFDRLLRKKGM